MSTKVVNTSLALILLVIMSVLSYSIIDQSIVKTELNDQVSTSMETSQSNEILFVSDSDQSLPLVAAGSGHFCMERTDGGVKCWGSNWWGQHGIGGTVEAAIPEPVDTASLGSGRYVIDLAGGNQHTCAVLDNNVIKCLSLIHI